MKRYLIGWFLLCSFPALSQTGGTFQFIQNKGQWDKTVVYSADLQGSAGFYLHKTGYTTQLINASDQQKLSQYIHGVHLDEPNETTVSSYARTSLNQPGKISDSLVVHMHAYHVAFLDANNDPTVEPEKPVETITNYFIGNDPSKWASNCKEFQALLYKNMYPGIDVRYYSEAGRLKYDLIVHPGADLSQVKLKYDHVDKLSVKNNQLHIATSVGEAVELYPYSYQPQATGRAEVVCKYKVKDNVVRFEVKEYDHNTVLVIDPTFVFASFSGSTGDNWGFTATYGGDGSMYMGGIANPGFPVSPGSYQVNFSGGDGTGLPGDMAIIKLSSDGKRRLFATYLGGNGRDQPHSLFEDPNGDLVIAGRTGSSNFPALTHVGNNGGWDIVVAKLSGDGTRLLGCMQIGGKSTDGANMTGDYSSQGSNVLKQNYGDDARSEVITDARGNIYLASCTQSSDFPQIGTAFQTTLKGTQDGVVLKINPALDEVQWSTFLGGTGFDASYVLSISPVSGELYVAGGTSSSDMPGIVPGVLQSTNKGGTCEGFLASLTDGGAGVTLNRLTYIGTSGIDQVYGVQFDKFGFPYVMGTTTGVWPILNAEYNEPTGKQFIAKLKADLSAFVYSTAFGSPNETAPNISPVAFLVDRCENVYVSGWGGKTNRIERYLTAGTGGLPITSNAIQSRTDGSDFYFFVLKKNSTSQLYGSYFGQYNGQFEEHVDGGTSRFDKNGVIYQAICANCGGGAVFPTAPPDVWSPNNRSNGRCNEAGVKIAFELAGVGSGLKASIEGRPANVLTGCLPMVVDFRDTIANGTRFEWSFGDGSADASTTIPTITHTYTNVGSYRVRLISIDSNSCNIADTAYTTVRARQDKAEVGFNQVKLPPCESLTYRFDNTSSPASGKAFSDSSFQWDFGDGSAVLSAGTQSITHTFGAVGTYTVKLTMVDTNFCNYPDLVSKTLRISPLVKAQFETLPKGCAPYNAIIKNTSLGGQKFSWNFGDGGTSTDTDPNHLYAAAGTYTIKMVAIDSASCNIIDSTTFTITVSDKPTAAFSWSPNPPSENSPVLFTNQSSADAVRFDWLFGDGDSLITSLRDTIVSHQYNSSGTYHACLVAVNAAGCSDTACNGVTTIVVPLLDVPNAFTPGRFGQNSEIKVRGFGIDQVAWTIYNRWGQVVFKANNINSGWDGKYKGELQAMDVYAYTLEVTFTDGTRIIKKGDITLLR